jgi:hypothetical protein
MTVTEYTPRRAITSQVLAHILEDIKGGVISSANEAQEVLDQYLLPQAAVRNVIAAAKELDKAHLSLVAAIAVVKE